MLQAWLARGKFAATHLSGIRDADEALLCSPESINAGFLQYYRSLYSTRVAYTPLELNSYPGQFDFPKLDPDICSGLDLDITLEEVQEAIVQLQPGKTPGEDGIPTKFFSLYQDLLAPRLTSL